MELFIEPLLCFEQLGDLNLELIAFAADNLNLTVLISRLEGDLFQLLVQLLNVLLVNLDLRDAELVRFLELLDLGIMLLFFAFHVALVERFLLLDVGHELC